MTAIEATQMGRLIAKHHRQDTAVRYPPISGPIPNATPEMRTKIVQFCANCSRDTLSAKMVRIEMLTPEHPIPCMARPRRNTGNEDVGAPVQMADPTIMMMIAACTAACRPKTSVIWAQKKRKAADVRLKEEIIQFSCFISSRLILSVTVTAQ